MVLHFMFFSSSRMKFSSTDHTNLTTDTSSSLSSSTLKSKGKEKKSNGSWSSLTTPWGTMARGRRNRPPPPKPQTNTLFYNSWGIPPSTHKVDPLQTTKVNNIEQVANIQAAKVRRFEKNQKNKNTGDVSPRPNDPNVNADDSNDALVSSPPPSKAPSHFDAVFTPPGLSSASSPPNPAPGPSFPDESSHAVEIVEVEPDVVVYDSQSQLLTIAMCDPNMYMPDESTSQIVTVEHAPYPSQPQSLPAGAPTTDPQLPPMDVSDVSHFPEAPYAPTEPPFSPTEPPFPPTEPPSFSVEALSPTTEPPTPSEPSPLTEPQSLPIQPSQTEPLHSLTEPLSQETVPPPNVTESSLPMPSPPHYSNRHGMIFESVSEMEDELSNSTMQLVQ